MALIMRLRTSTAVRIRSTKSLTQNRWISTSWRLWDMTRGLAMCLPICNSLHVIPKQPLF